MQLELNSTMKRNTYISLIVTLMLASLGCRTASDTNHQGETQLLAASDQEAKQRPFSILDVDYEIRSFFPLSVFVSEQSLLPFLEKRMEERQNEFSPAPNREVKDATVSNIKADFTEGGLNVSFRLNFKFRKCTGKLCGWWQPAQTTNYVKFAISVNDWIMQAKLNGVKVHVDNDFLNAMIGDMLASEVASQMSKEINHALANVSGKSMREIMAETIPERATFIMGITSFDAAALEDGLLVTLSRQKLREQTAAE